MEAETSRRGEKGELDTPEQLPRNLKVIHSGTKTVQAPLLCPPQKGLEKTWMCEVIRLLGVTRAGRESLNFRQFHIFYV